MRQAAGRRQAGGVFRNLMAMLVVLGQSARNG